MAEFGAGLVVGVLGGFFLYPLFWWWVAWREYREASRRARRIEGVLADMSKETDRLSGRSKGLAEENNGRRRTLRPTGR